MELFQYRVSNKKLNRYKLAFCASLIFGLIGCKSKQTVISINDAPSIITIAGIRVPERNREMFLSNVSISMGSKPFSYGCLGKLEHSKYTVMNLARLNEINIVTSIPKICLSEHRIDSAHTEISIKDKSISVLLDFTPALSKSNVIIDSIVVLNRSTELFDSSAKDLSAQDTFTQDLTNQNKRFNKRRH